MKTWYFLIANQITEILNTIMNTHNIVDNSINIEEHLSHSYNLKV